MTFEAILAYLHLLAIFTLIVFLTSEAALCRPEWMNEGVVRRLAMVDRVYGIAAGTLVSVLDEFAAPPNGVYAVFPQRKHLPLRVRLWIDFLKERYADAAYWSAAAQ